VIPAREAAKAASERPQGQPGQSIAGAIELRDGTIITGSNSTLMHSATSLIMHAVKHLAGVPEKIKLLPDYITESVTSLKTEILQEKSASLDWKRLSIALCISARTNPARNWRSRRSRNCVAARCT